MLNNLIFKRREDFILKLIINPILDTEINLKQIKNIGSLREDDISRNLVRILKRKGNFSHIYKKGHIIILFQGEFVNTKIKKPDFQLIYFRLFQSVDIIIEAKRIYDSSSIDQYCGKNGFQRFSSGYYECNEFFGMLGYVQKGDVNNHIISIFQKISFLSKKEINEKCHLTKHNFSNGSKSCFHTFLDLRN